MVISKCAGPFNMESLLSDKEEGAPGPYEDATTRSTPRSRAAVRLPQQEGSATRPGAGNRAERHSMKPSNNSLDSLQGPVGDGGGGDRSSIAKNNARLFIRNLSFKADKDSLRAHFEELGEVVDVNIPRRPDGSVVGCAFVEYKKVLYS